MSGNNHQTLLSTMPFQKPRRTSLIDLLNVSVINKGDYQEEEATETHLIRKYCSQEGDFRN